MVDFNIIYYIFWETKNILRPQIQRILNDNTICDQKIISEYVSQLTPFDCSRFIHLGENFILENFSFWLRRYNINELSQNN